MDGRREFHSTLRQFPLRKPWHHSLRITYLITALLLLHLAGLTLFFNGFLLSRTSLNQYSTADEPTVVFDGTDHGGGRAQSRPFDRAFIMVIDALRLDFVKAQPYSNAARGGVEIMPRLQDLVKQLV